MARLPYSPGVWALIVVLGLMHVGFYMLVPLLAVHLTRDRGFDAATVGLILALRLVVQQGLAPVGGALGDRIGYKPSIVAGLLVRTAGFLLFAVDGGLEWVLAASVVSALGGTLFEPPSRAALGALTPERDRADVYAAGSAASWIGQAVGPLIGALLLPVSFVWVCVAAAAMFLLAALQTAVILPGGARGEVAGVSLWGSIAAAMRDRDFARFTVLLLGYHFLLVQLVLSLPLLTSRVAGPEAVGTILALQAGLGVALQVPLVRWTSRLAGPLVQLGGGLLVAGLGFAAYALASDFVGLLAPTILVALGLLVCAPVQSTVTANLAGANGGAYFGVSMLALAVGGGIGNAAGGLLIDLGDQTGAPWLPWLTMSAVALLSAGGFLWLVRDTRLRARLSSRGMGGKSAAAAVGQPAGLGR